MSNSPNTKDSANPEGMVTVKTYATEVAAETAASCLEGHGIHCTLSADDCGGMLSAMDNYSGVKLSVKAEDLQSAQDILAPEKTA